MPINMQLLSVDGVSVSIPRGMSEEVLIRLGGVRFKLHPCELATRAAAGTYQSLPLCVSNIVLMPSARAEVFVTAQGTATATLETSGFNTCPYRKPKTADRDRESANTCSS
jgi:hypothetical protein